MYSKQNGGVCGSREKGKKKKKKKKKKSLLCIFMRHYIDDYIQGMRWDET